MINKSKLNSDLKKFDQAYLSLRKKENRVFSLEEIEQLPDIQKKHPHAKEWMKRKHTFQMFLKYIKQKEFKSICDLACGNGWFINQLAFHFDLAVGIEVNEIELQQAADLLQKHNNVRLYLGDVFELELEEKFDLISVNAAIQYFQPFDKIIARLLDLLTNNGELHILDSPFYKNHRESTQAKARSQEYYSQNNASDLNDFYHHRNLMELNKYNFKIMYNPNTISNKVKRKLKPFSPFHWVKISK